MIKSLFIDNLYYKLNKEYTKSDLNKIYDTIIELILNELEEESSKLKTSKVNNVTVSIPNLGKFKVILQDSYIGRNPLTKKKMRIEASNRIYYSPSKNVKNCINNKQ